MSLRNRGTGSKGSPFFNFFRRLLFAPAASSRTGTMRSTSGFQTGIYRISCSTFYILNETNANRNKTVSCSTFYNINKTNAN